MSHSIEFAVGEYVVIEDPFLADNMRGLVYKVAKVNPRQLHVDPVTAGRAGVLPKTLARHATPTERDAALATAAKTPPLSRGAVVTVAGFEGHYVVLSLPNGKTIWHITAPLGGSTGDRHIKALREHMTLIDPARIQIA
ncbi:hypothetical protein [Nocardia sp. NBC_00511]|uniref:hypothetical protein n=1 Tax=Nocardia sp. NBC_00511 TaxID=2903591 RepID=UPI002F90AE05